jgi:plasmid stabilization system protein ParE
LAIADLDSAYEYVAAEEPTAAEGLIDRIEEATSILARYSSAGRIGRVAGTRELVVTGTPFILPYRVGKNVVEILAVIHGSRKWPEKF